MKSGVPDYGFQKQFFFFKSMISNLCCFFSFYDLQPYISALSQG